MTSDKPDRLHALDNLRAIMMWLGIVLHVAVIHLAAENTQIPWRDTQRTVVADLLLSFIHAFRMPVFFVLAGFFAAMLAQARGAEGMLHNRVRRLAWPFVAFWPFLYLATGLAGIAFLNLMAYGRWGLDEGAIPASAPRDANTLHMWFLWLLLWMCVATSLLMRLPRAWFAPADALLARLARSGWGFAVLALPLMLAGMHHPQGVLLVSGSFVPPWDEWLHHGVFFAAGLVLHGRRQELFALWQARRWHYAAAGLVFYVATGAARDRGAPTWAIAYLYGCTSWLWTFALVGIALRAGGGRQRLLAYLADSAYWVYLMHLPLTIVFGALLYGIEVHALVKMGVNIVATTVVCLASYQLLVRHTWVSLLLNGKRHPRASGGTPAAATG